MKPLPDIRASEREAIVGALGPSPVDIDQLIRATGLPARKVHIVPLELDLAGRLQRHATTCVANRALTSLAVRGLLVIGFFERYVQQIGEERHLRALGRPRVSLQATKRCIQRPPDA